MTIRIRRLVLKSNLYRFWSKKDPDFTSELRFVFLKFCVTRIVVKKFDTTEFFSQHFSSDYYNRKKLKKQIYILSCDSTCIWKKFLDYLSILRACFPGAAEGEQTKLSGLFPPPPLALSFKIRVSVFSLTVFLDRLVGWQVLKVKNLGHFSHERIFSLYFNENSPSTLSPPPSVTVTCTFRVFFLTAY